MSDDEDTITENWLERVGFRLDSMSASILLEPIGNGAIVDLRLQPESESADWFAYLLQGYPDDPNAVDDHVTITSKAFKTRGDVRRLVAALGVELKESA